MFLFSQLNFDCNLTTQMFSPTHRNELLKELINLYRESDNQSPDFVQMVQCLIFLDDPNTVAGILETLSQGSEDDVLMAYQIAFDLYESATQQFLNNVLQALKRTAPIPDAVKVEGKPLPPPGKSLFPIPHVHLHCYC